MYKQTVSSNVDSYKLGHADQYPKGTEIVYSNLTPRSLAHFDVPDAYKPDRIVWFGLQAFLREMNHIWKETFFKRNEEEVVEEFKSITSPFCGPNGFNTDRIRALHRLGYLPLSIRSLPEGSRVNIGVPCLTIYNTLSEFYWLTNWMETWMSAELWKASTSATMSYTYRKIIETWSEFTECGMSFVTWQGHDFSIRGMSGIHDAAMSGAGHLLSFSGTDNLPAVKLLRDCYDGDKTFIGGSVPATEHSVMCAGGKESELDTFKRLLETYPKGIISIVSDTWDFWKVLTEYTVELKAIIMARGDDEFGNHKVVFRPDSGDPVKIICGDPEAPHGSPEFKGAVQVLWEIFGGTINNVGFATLDSHIGLIYGDSITASRCEEILSRLAYKGFAANNVVFGIGSYTFQHVTRDCLGFAMKATAVRIDGLWQAIFKEPKTDSGTKKSARGMLSVYATDNGFKLVESLTVEDWLKQPTDDMELVYIDGYCTGEETLMSIRDRLHQG